MEVAVADVSDEAQVQAFRDHVVAELGTQSGKAKKAAQYGKPIISFDDFLAWADGTSSPAEAVPAEDSAQVRISAL